MQNHSVMMETSCHASLLRSICPGHLRGDGGGGRRGGGGDGSGSSSVSGPLLLSLELGLQNLDLLLQTAVLLGDLLLVTLGGGEGRLDLLEFGSGSGLLLRGLLGIRLQTSKLALKGLDLVLEVAALRGSLLLSLLGRGEAGLGFGDLGAQVRLLLLQGLGGRLELGGLGLEGLLLLRVG